jgi:hypothetical protein
MAVYPSQQEEQLVLKQSDTLVPVALDEVELIKQEVCHVLEAQHGMHMHSDRDRLIRSTRVSAETPCACMDYDWPIFGCECTQVVEVASGSAIILPMVKDMFLIGFVVVEGVTIGQKTGKLRPVKPVWPPKKGTRTPAATIPLSKQQLTELPKIARTLALACVVDQVYLNHLLGACSRY